MNKPLAELENKSLPKTRNGNPERVQNAPAFAREHPLRYCLTNELHARPFEQLSPPVQISMYATVLDPTGEDVTHAHLLQLCQRYGVHAPAPESNHFSADFGPFRLRFERHTEFANYMVIRHGKFDSPFRSPASLLLPPDWLDALPGDMLVATHLAILTPDSLPPDRAQLSELFVPESLVTSTVSGTGGQVWTDLRIHADGHNRILLQAKDLPPAKAGRVAQRLLEIAAYRNFALLALPIARKIAPILNRIDMDLAELTSEMARIESGDTGKESADETDADNERDTSEDIGLQADLLTRLMKISSEIESLNARHSYRFSAARAYSELVRSRLVELREERHSGYQTIQEFLDRRLWPAMRTCESVEDRLATLSRRASRAANLLRTRVDFSLENQNQALLSSMNRRARLQLRLQQTVEGLSVVAITYYTVGLIGYGAKAFGELKLPISSLAVQAIAVPVVALVVWAGLRRIRRQIEKQE